MVECPDCGAEMNLRETKKYLYGNGEPRKFWGCSRWPECKATHGAHPDGKPVGVPADTETKRMRMAAHRCAEIAFGRWETKQGKQDLYEWLRRRPNIKQHIGEMNKLDCLEFIGKLIDEGLVREAQTEAIIDKLMIPKQ